MMALQSQRWSFVAPISRSYYALPRRRKEKEVGSVTRVDVVDVTLLDPLARITTFLCCDQIKILPGLQ